MIVIVASMELQLGLALPCSASKGFDLNCHDMESKELSLSLNSLDLQGPCFSSSNGGYVHCENSTSNDDNDNNNNTNTKKRGFDEAFYNEQSFTAVPITLPLLHWDNPSNDEDDPENSDDKDNYSAASNITIDEDEDSVVGWPLINSWRKKLCYENNLTVKNSCGCSDGGARLNINSTYVKVQMEGVAIARKVDLSLCSSHHMLVQTLMDMFSIWIGDPYSYRLAYQDKEGDWLLAQDVPWRSFIQTVQRLKLMKSST